MLDPRIVAASTHGRDFAEHGVDGIPTLTSASSHDGFIPDSDAQESRKDSRCVKPLVCVETHDPGTIFKSSEK